jgi:mono/diheme cytochrome c family protein
MKKIAYLSSALIFVTSTIYAATPDESWSKLCASCHGKDGKAHTKAAKKMDVKDLTDASYAKTFTDEDAFKSLKMGLKDKDGKERMKPFSEKLSDDEIKGLVAYVRGLSK